MFGYAHVPWVKKHQSLIDTATLAGPVDRFAMATAGAKAILGAGYESIGIDHFAKPATAWRASSGMGPCGAISRATPPTAPTR
jgi:coproporphyrinogen III oxidase-like Fe-S oxidoreductase